MSVRNSTCVFQEEAGISPAEFVKVVRVDWARLLLEYTEKPLQVCEFRHHAARTDVYRNRAKVNCIF